jgi:phosphatidate phosphatase
MDNAIGPPQSFLTRGCVVALLDLPGLAVVAALALVQVALFLSLDVTPLDVPPNDALSDFPYPGTETVPNGVAVLLLFAINATVIVALFFLGRCAPAHFRAFHLFRAVWAFLAAWLLVLAITEGLKCYVGRPRPDIYARCGYNATYAQCAEALGAGAKDAFKSWPSGHSSNSMCAGTFAGLFVQRGVRSAQLWVALLGAAFLLFGFGVGASRIRDYRHHADDVLAGLFIGWVCTYMVWGRARRRIFETQEGDARESIP